MFTPITFILDCIARSLIRPPVWSDVYTKRDLKALEGDIRLEKRLPLKGLLGGCTQSPGTLGALEFRRLCTSGGDDINGQGLENVEGIKRYADKTLEGISMLLAGGLQFEDFAYLITNIGSTHFHSVFGVKGPQKRAGSVKRKKSARHERDLNQAF